MIELRHQGVEYESIKHVPLRYDGHYLGVQPVRLIKVDDKMLLATVAVKQLTDAMLAQLKARLRHLGLQLGLLTNFDSTTLQVQVVRQTTTN